MAKEKTLFACTACGFETAKWTGKCPGCGAWNTMEEGVVPSRPPEKGRRPQRPGTGAAAMLLKDIPEDVTVRTSTGVSELDRVLGGGIVEGALMLIGGDPGVGKTTIILDMLADIRLKNPGVRVLFVSAEMNEIDLAVYVKRFPKFQDLDILFVESEFDDNCQTHNYYTLTEILDRGWDIVAIDSFYELQGIVKEEENITQKKAESMLLSLIKQQNKAQNSRSVNTTFLTIQQVTKSGAFIGSNRLKHAITAMLELRLDNPKNVYSDRYAVFTKHRRGDVGVRLYYDLSTTGDVFYNEERFNQDRQIRRLQSEAGNSMRSYAEKFDRLFDNIKTMNV